MTLTITAKNEITNSYKCDKLGISLDKITVTIREITNDNNDIMVLANIFPNITNLIPAGEVYTIGRVPMILSLLISPAVEKQLQFQTPIKPALIITSESKLSFSLYLNIKYKNKVFKKGLTKTEN